MHEVAVFVSESWVRRIKSPLYMVVAALTGVSITFVPMYLYMLGRSQTPGHDVRVLVCFAVIFCVSFFHIKLAQHVIKQIRD